MYSVHVSSNSMRSIDSFYASLLESILTDGEHHRVLRRIAYLSRPPLEFSLASPVCTGSGCCTYQALCVVAIQGSNILLCIHSIPLLGM